MGHNLFKILQNNAIGAIALHSFTLGYYKASIDKSFPTLEYIFYVLPIVYNKTSMNCFRSSNKLYTSLSKEKTIIVGLQDRANKMSVQTFDSLNIAFSKKILTYNKENKSIEILRGFKSNKIPLDIEKKEQENSVEMIQDSAYKLGSIFARVNKKELQRKLNIRF